MVRLGRDSWLAAALTAASLLLALITPGQVTGEPTQVVGPATLPVALALSIAGLSLALFLSSLRTPPAPEEKDDGRLWPVLALTALIALYVVALPLIGYSAVTGVLVVGLCFLFGERRWWIIAALAIGVPLALMVFFERFMVILLPGGPWT